MVSGMAAISLDEHLAPGRGLKPARSFSGRAEDSESLLGGEGVQCETEIVDIERFVQEHMNIHLGISSTDLR